MTSPHLGDDELELYIFGEAHRPFNPIHKPIMHVLLCDKDGHALWCSADEGEDGMKGRAKVYRGRAKVILNSKRGVPKLLYRPGQHGAAMGAAQQKPTRRCSPRCRAVAQQTRRLLALQGRRRPRALPPQVVALRDRLTQRCREPPGKILS